MLLVTIAVLMANWAPSPGQDPASPVLASAQAGGQTQLEAALEKRLQDLVERGIPGASAAIVLPGGGLLRATAGFADPATKAAMTPEHLFLAGSTGKTYVTGLIHLLAQREQLDLGATAASFWEGEDQPWLDRLPNGRSVTLHQLLRHRSGIPRYVFHADFAASMSSDPERVWRPEELLSYAGETPLSEPDTAFAYADTNYILLGMVVERATGKRFYDLVRDELLAPAELKATHPTNVTQLDNMAQGQVVMGRQLGVAEHTLAEGSFTYNVQFEWCGGGWATTPTDLAQWVTALYSGKALGEESLRILLASEAAPELGPGVRYGAGVMLRTTALGELRHHDGFMPGYLTSAGYFPEQQLGIALQLSGDNARALGQPLSLLLVELAQLALAPR